MKVAATVGFAVAMFVGAAGAGSAAQTDFGKPLTGAPQKESGVSAQRTNGHSFWEVNAAGQLVYWTRAGGSFSGQVRGSGWENTRQIASLNENVFVEIKGDYRLSKWTWTGSGFIEEHVGTDWQPSRIITGIDDNRFAEIKHDGQLVEWTFTGAGLAPWNIGQGWQNTRLLAGFGGPEDHIIDLLEVKNSGLVSEWYGVRGDLREYVLQDADFNVVELMTATDPNHFLVILKDGALFEFTLGEDNVWRAVQVGQGWTGTKLLG